MEAVRARTGLDPIREVPDLPFHEQRRVSFRCGLDLEVGKRKKTVSERRHRTCILYRRTRTLISKSAAADLWFGSRILYDTKFLLIKKIKN